MGRYLVTGATGGMGAAVCKALRSRGHTVWGIDRNASKDTAGFRFLEADVRRKEDLLETFEIVRREAGTLDGIIHTAGIYDLNSLVEMPEEDFVRDFDINLFGIYRVNSVFHPLLGPGGRIVMISSELAPLAPLPFTGIYAITKSAVEGYASALRAELQLLGHSVIVIRPGAVKTDMLPASAARLDDFCSSTRLYAFSAERFRRIVDTVENRSVSPDRIARIVLLSLEAKIPRFVYNVNRNPWLRLLDMLPLRLQLRILRYILSSK